MARDLSRAYNFADIPYLDGITLAAAFHDTYKGGEGETWTETLKEHPDLAVAALSPKALGRSRLPFEVDWARAGIRDHMSMWGPEEVPVHRLHPLAQVVSTADYIASRKYLEPSAELSELLKGFYYEEG